MVLSVIGKGGSGKTSIAIEIAKICSQNGVTGLISTELRYSPLPRILNINIPEEKSMINAIISSDDIEEFFVFDEETELNVIALSNNSDITNYASFTNIIGDSNFTTDKQIETVNKFISSMEDIVDYLVVDGTDRVSDPLTYGFLSKSDIIINIIENSILGITYQNAHKPILDILKEKSKIVNVLNKHQEHIINKVEVEKITNSKINFTIKFDEKINIGQFSTSNNKIFNSIFNSYIDENKKEKFESKFSFFKKKVKK